MIQKRVVDRIKEYSEAKGISIRQIESTIGASNGVINNAIKRGSDISTKWASSIVDNYRDINPAWLLLGEGDMILKDSHPEVKKIYNPKYTEKIIEEQYVPYYSWEATAGIIPLFHDSSEYEVGKIIVPNMPECDGAVSVTGDSMYPILKSGDIVAYKVIHDIANLHYGDMYLISINEEGDTYTAVKWINKHPSDASKVILLSNNEHYAPREVKISNIQGVALVKLMIRYNSMV